MQPVCISAARVYLAIVQAPLQSQGPTHPNRSLNLNQCQSRAINISGTGCTYTHSDKRSLLPPPRSLFQQCKGCLSDSCCSLMLSSHPTVYPHTNHALRLDTNLLTCLDMLPVQRLCRLAEACNKASENLRASLRRGVMESWTVNWPCFTKVVLFLCSGHHTTKCIGCIPLTPDPSQCGKQT